MLSYVEFIGGSKWDGQEATLEFKDVAQELNTENPEEQVMTGFVTGCSFHDGHGAAIELNRASHIEMEDNNIYAHTQFGLKVKDSSYWSFEDNRVIYIKQRAWIVTSDSLVDEEGSVYFCPFYADDCHDYKVNRNIIAGGYLGGLYMYSHQCGASDTQQKTRDNVVHSMKRVCGVVFPDHKDPDIVSSKVGDQECHEVSHFKAYKCQEDGLMAMSKFQGDFTVRDVAIADSYYGIAVHNSDNENGKTYIRDSVIYGDTASPDDASCHTKIGMYLPSMPFGTKSHIVSSS